MAQNDQHDELYNFDYDHQASRPSLNISYFGPDIKNGGVKVSENCTRSRDWHALQVLIIDFCYQTSRSQDRTPLTPNLPCAKMAKSKKALFRVTGLRKGKILTTLYIGLLDLVLRPKVLLDTRRCRLWRHDNYMQFDLISINYHN